MPRIQAPRSCSCPLCSPGTELAGPACCMELRLGVSLGLPRSDGRWMSPWSPCLWADSIGDFPCPPGGSPMLLVPKKADREAAGFLQKPRLLFRFSGHFPLRTFILALLAVSCSQGRGCMGDEPDFGPCSPSSWGAGWLHAQVLPECLEPCGQVAGARAVLPCSTARGSR